MKPSPTKLYINPKTDIRNSKIAGRGVFAKRKIKKGEIIHVSEGNIMSLKEYNALPEKYKGLCYDMDGKKLLCPKDFNKITEDWYVNHSCDANCGSSDYYTLVAMKNIEPGEEITYDYATSDCDPHWFMKCKCGAKKCRKFITGNDWKIKEIQNRYAGYFQKNIQDKIDSLK